jgi:hypothetical protein
VILRLTLSEAGYHAQSSFIERSPTDHFHWHRGLVMKPSLRLLFLFCSVTAFSQCQPFRCQPTPSRILMGSLIVGNTNQGVTFFFLHLDAPGTMPYVIDDVVIDVNGKKNTPSQASDQSRLPAKYCSQHRIWLVSSCRDHRLMWLPCRSIS